MASYVVGFAFSGKKLLLIEKNRPAFQAGKLNGIGGKIEGDETPEKAMAREFKEETGITRTRWTLFCTLTIPKELSHYDTDVVVHFLKTDTDRIWRANQTTDEELHLINWAKLPDNCMSNLHWLVPMAKDGHHYFVNENKKL